MSTVACAACTTPYASDLDACPHCGSGDYVEEGHAVTRRLPLFVKAACSQCGRGPWNLRLPQLLPGLIDLPDLFCASCGSQVQFAWPAPVEEDMSPKITVHGGATNARESAEPSPDAAASQPLVGAEADQGRPTPVPEPEVQELRAEAAVGEALPELPVESYGEDAVPTEGAPGYDGMTLAELRDEAALRGVPSYGTKAQITERLRADDDDDESAADVIEE